MSANVPLSPAEVLGVDAIPPALTAQQAAALLGVSKQTIYRAHEDGELQGLKVRGRLVIAARPLLESLGWGPPAPSPSSAPPCCRHPHTGSSAPV